LHSSFHRRSCAAANISQGMVLFFRASHPFKSPVV
jgi:hypothetical protein